MRWRWTAKKKDLSGRAWQERIKPDGRSRKFLTRWRHKTNQTRYFKYVNRGTVWQYWPVTSRWSRWIICSDGFQEFECSKKLCLFAENMTEVPKCSKISVHTACRLDKFSKIFYIGTQVHTLRKNTTPLRRTGTFHNFECLWLCVCQMSTNDVTHRIEWVRCTHYNLVMYCLDVSSPWSVRVAHIPLLYCTGWGACLILYLSFCLRCRPWAWVSLTGNPICAFIR